MPQQFYTEEEVKARVAQAQENNRGSREDAALKGGCFAVFLLLLALFADIAGWVDILH